MGTKLEFWKIDDETYLLKSPTYSTPYLLKTENSDVDIELKSHSTYPKPVRIYQKRSRHIGWNTTVNGVEITNDQHILNMKPFFTLDEEGEKEWLYPGAKNDFNSYMESYSRKPINEEYEEELEFEIFDIPNLSEEELKYVTPLWHYQDQNRGNCKLVQFNAGRYAVDRFWSEANRYEIKNISVPDHGGLRFAQIDKNYVGDDGMDYKIGTYTVEQYRAQKQYINEKLDTIFKKHHAKNLKFSKESVETLIDFITSATKRLYDLDVKSKSASDKSLLLKMMNDKKNDLFKLIKLPGETE